MLTSTAYETGKERVAKEDNPTPDACKIEGGWVLDVSLGLHTCPWPSPADMQAGSSGEEMVLERLRGVHQPMCGSWS